MAHRAPAPWAQTEQRCVSGRLRGNQRSNQSHPETTVRWGAGTGDALSRKQRFDVPSGGQQRGFAPRRDRGASRASLPSTCELSSPGCFSPTAQTHQFIEAAVARVPRCSSVSRPERELGGHLAHPSPNDRKVKSKQRRLAGALGPHPLRPTIGQGEGDGVDRLFSSLTVNERAGGGVGTASRQGWRSLRCPPNEPARSSSPVVTRGRCPSRAW